MSAVSTSPASVQPLDLPELPEAVRVGLEIERRGLQPPKHIADLVSEFRRRGIVGQQPGSSTDYRMSEAERQRRAALRLQQIEQQPGPSEEDRSRYIGDKSKAYYDQLEQAYEAHPGRDHKPGLWDRITGDTGLTAEEYESFDRYAGPALERKAEEYGREFDEMHSPMARFAQQRQQVADQLAEGYRAKWPASTDQEVLRHVQEELARRGFTPSFAGQLGATNVDDPERQRAEVDEAGMLGYPLAAGQGFVEGFQNLIGKAGAGIVRGSAEMEEALWGTDTQAMKDIARGIDHYWTETVASRPSESGGKRFTKILGRGFADLSTMVALGGAAGAVSKSAGASNRLARIISMTVSTGGIGGLEGANAYDELYDKLIERGYEPSVANSRALQGALGVGVVNAMLERVPAGEFLFRFRGQTGRLAGAFRGLVAEGGTEAAQEFVNVLAEMEAGAGESLVNWQNVERILTAAAAGSILGGGMGLATGGRGVQADIAEAAEAEALEIRRMIEDAAARQEQQQRTEGKRTRPDAPQSESQALDRETDPRVIANARQMRRWAERRMPDDTQQIDRLEQAVKDAGERFRKVIVPGTVLSVDRVDPQRKPSGLNPDKVRQLAQADPQSKRDWPPLVAVPREDGQALRVLDGRHRVVSTDNPSQRWAVYVPASVADAIEAGTFGVAPPTTTEEGTAPTDEGVEPGREDAGPSEHGTDEQHQGRERTSPDEPLTTEQQKQQQEELTDDDRRLRVLEDAAEAARGSENPDLMREVAQRLRRHAEKSRRGQRTRSKRTSPEAVERAERLADGLERAAAEQQRRRTGADKTDETSDERLTRRAREAIQQARTAQLGGEQQAIRDAIQTLAEVAAEIDAAPRVNEEARGLRDQAREIIEEMSRGDAPRPRENEDTSDPRWKEEVEAAEQTFAKLKAAVDRLARESRENMVTGGLNRRAFADLFEKAQRQADAEGKPLAVVAFDAANLKTVNDTQGDEAGDAYLRRVHRALQNTSRNGADGRRADAFHYGGDEFALLIYDADQATAEAIRTRAEEALEPQEVVPGVSTFLVGDVAVYEPGSGRGMSELLTEATDAMKARKNRAKAAMNEATTREEAEQRRRDAADTQDTGDQQSIPGFEQLGAERNRINAAIDLIRPTYPTPAAFDADRDAWGRAFARAREQARETPDDWGAIVDAAYDEEFAQGNLPDDVDLVLADAVVAATRDLLQGDALDDAAEQTGREELAEGVDTAPRYGFSEDQLADQQGELVIVDDSLIDEIPVYEDDQAGIRASIRVARAPNGQFTSGARLSVPRAGGFQEPLSIDRFFYNTRGEAIQAALYTLASRTTRRDLNNQPDRTLKRQERLSRAINQMIGEVERGNLPETPEETVTQDDIESRDGGQLVDEPTVQESRTVAGDPKIAKTLRNLAEGMQGQIDNKLNPSVAEQRPTARRQRQAASMREDGERLQRIQTALLRLADAHEANEVPPPLAQVKTKTQVEALTDAGGYPRIGFPGSMVQDTLDALKGRKGVMSVRDKVGDIPRGDTFLLDNITDDERRQRYLDGLAELVKLANKAGGRAQQEAREIKSRIAPAERLAKAGITSDNFAEAKQALEELTGDAQQREAARQRREEQRRQDRLATFQAPGYFPTPVTVVHEIMLRADIEPDHTVLEPSAGKGDILAGIEPATPPGWEPSQATAVEVNPTLAEELRRQGWEVIEGDFTQMDPMRTYDRVVMNPPFERSRDIEHVKHAYRFLKPGGRLVAVMSEGPFFRGDAKARSFRDWLERVGGQSEQLPEGSFQPSGTNVATRLVTIDKPAEGSGPTVSGPDTTPETPPETPKDRSAQRVEPPEGMTTRPFDDTNGPEALPHRTRVFVVGPRDGTMGDPSLTRNQAASGDIITVDRSNGFVLSGFDQDSRPAVVDARNQIVHVITEEPVDAQASEETQPAEGSSQTAVQPEQGATEGESQAVDQSIDEGREAVPDETLKAAYIEQHGLNAEQARKIIERFRGQPIEGKQPIPTIEVEIDGEMVPVTKHKTYLWALEVIGSDLTEALPVHTENGIVARAWLYSTDDPKKEPRRKEIREKWEAGGQPKTFKRTPAGEVKRRSKPSQRGMVKKNTDPQLLKWMGKQGNDEDIRHKIAWVDQEGAIYTTNGRAAFRLAKSEGAFGERGAYKLPSGTKLTPAADNETPRQPESIESVFHGTEPMQIGATAGELVTAFRQVNAITTADDANGALLLRNPDGTLGVAFHAHTTGMVEVNVKEGATDTRLFAKPRWAMDMAEFMARSLGHDAEVSLREGRKQGRHASIHVVGEAGGRKAEVVLAVKIGEESIETLREAARDDGIATSRFRHEKGPAELVQVDPLVEPITQEAQRPGETASSRRARLEREAAEAKEGSEQEISGPDYRGFEQNIRGEMPEWFDLDVIREPFDRLLHYEGAGGLFPWKSGSVMYSRAGTPAVNTFTAASMQELEEGIRARLDELGRENEAFEGFAGMPISGGAGFDATTGRVEPMGSPAGEELSGDIQDRGNLPEGRSPGHYLNDRHPNLGKHRSSVADRPRAIRRSITEARIARARAKRDGKLTAQTTDNVHAIISDMARRLQVGPPGIARNRGLARAFLGYYYPDTENIRIRRAGMVQTMVHELGHHLHKSLFPNSTTGLGNLSASAFPDHWKPELLALGKELYGDKEPASGYRAEGWAQVTAFLVTNPRHLKAQAPTVYADVVRRLTAERPDVWLTLLDARVRLINAVLDAQGNPIRQHIDRTTGRDWLNLTNLWDSFRAKWLDRQQRLVTMLRDLGLDSLPHNANPHTAALRVTGHISGDVKTMIERGRFVPNDPARRRIGPSLAEILQPLAEKSNRELWEEYMVARRVLEKREQGYEPLPQDPRLPDSTSREKLEAFIRRTEADHPEFGDYFKARGPVRYRQDDDGNEIAVPTEAPDTVAARFREFNNWLVKEYAVHYGLLEPEVADLIVRKNLEYLTFRHKKTEDALARESGARSSRGGFASQSSGFRRFREGKGEQLFPPLDAFAASLQGIVSRAQLNHVANMVTSLHDRGVAGVGRWLDKIDRPMDAHKIGGAQLSEEIQKQLGIEIDKGGNVSLPPYLKEIDEDAAMQLVEAVASIQGATFWQPGTRTDRENRELWVLKGGKPRFYEVKDRRLFELLEGLGNNYSRSLLIKLIGIPTRTLRAGATQYNPSFFIPNFLRDTLQSITMTESELRRLPQQTRLRYEGMREAFLGGKWYDLFLASGADMSGIFGEYYNPLKAQLDYDSMFGARYKIPIVKGSTPRQIARDIVKLGGIERLNQGFELANRLGEFAVVYEQSIERGVAESEAIAAAGQAAADVTIDFQRGGSWAKEINQVIVFFNAALQGTDKIGRFIKRHPVKSFGRIVSTMIVPSILQFLLNWDNEDFWAKPLEERDRHWYFPTGFDRNGRRTYLKIPKPYGLAVFSIATERSLAYMAGINPEDGESRGDPGAFNGAAWAMIRELRPTLNIAGLQPLFEAMAGDRGWSFFWDNHIVSGADQDLPAPMQGADRSSELGRVLGEFLGVSPAKVDYVISGWFGGLGRDAVATLIDPAIALVDPDAKQGEPLDFDDYLIVRRFLAGSSRGDHEAITRFYRQYEELKRVNAGLNALEDQPEKYRRYAQRHDTALALWPIYSNSHARLSAGFRRVRGLYARREEMDSDRFDRQVQREYDWIITQARAAHQAAQTQE